MLEALSVFCTALVALGVAAWGAFPAHSVRDALERRARYGVAGLCFVALCAMNGLPRSTALSVLAACLCVCAATDFETGYIPDVVTFPVLATELLVAVTGASWESAVQGALACAAVIAALYVLTRGRGIGLGDLKLAACIGAALGAQGGLWALGCAFITGALHAGSLLALRRIQRRDPLRFAPYLAVGCVPAVFWSGLPWA